MESEIILHNSCFLKCQSSVKDTSQNYFLEKIFWPAESKHLRLTIATSELQLGHGVWGLQFKGPPSVSTKTVSLLLRDPNDINANNCLCKRLLDNFM